MNNPIEHVFDDRVAVDSTIISDVARAGLDLYVKFKTTNTWYMLEDAADRYDELVYADSPNGWYHRNLKGQYRTFKLYTQENPDTPDTIKVFDLQQC